MLKGPNVFVGYYKQEEATRDTMTADGWLKTGDAGFFDKQGQLVIIDRAKDVGKLADGSPFAPQFIENKLKFSPFIREAVAFGDQRPFVVAMIAIDIQTVGTWAEQRGLAYTSFMDLARKPEVARLIVDEIAKVNATLPDDPGRAHPAPQQGARGRRRRDDAHPQGPPPLRGREVCARHRGVLRRPKSRPTSPWRSPSRTAASTQLTTKLAVYDVVAPEGARRMAA